MYGHTEANLIAYFTPARSLRSITTEDAEKFREWLKTAPSRKGKKILADATVNRRTRVARAIFNKALKWKYVDDNPFADVSAGSECNRDRMYEVSEADSSKILAHCPDVEWKVLFSLSRWGGLRCPSEHLALKWSDVDFAAKRLTVRSCKTERYVGGAFRVMPLFPEIESALLEARKLAPDDTEYVITRCRNAGVNLRSQFKRIIRRAGLTAWPRLFHNLRSTRQSELTRTNPEYVVCRWLGNSPAIARRNYLQVSDDDFKRGLGLQTGSQQSTIKKPPLQAPLYASASDVFALQGSATITGVLDVNSCGVQICNTGAGFLTSPISPRMGDTGFEPVTSCVSFARKPSRCFKNEVLKARESQFFYII